jgi:penicillin V acylase-like amidase (Ntn superfamily)
LCEWALGTCSSVTEFADALANNTVTVVGPSVAGGQHYVLRDSDGTSAVVEFLNGRTVVTIDYNDNGATGFGESCAV